MTRASRNFAIAVLAATLPATAGAEDALLSHPLAADELSDLRGGFVLPNGAALSIAADLHSYVDGQMVLGSQLVLTDNGWAEPAGSPPQNLPANLSGLQELAGRTIQGIGGSTTLVHAVRDNQVLNIVVNDAMNRTVSQHLGLEMRVDNYWDMREAWRNELAAIRLADPGR